MMRFVHTRSGAETPAPSASASFFCGVIAAMASNYCLSSRKSAARRAVAAWVSMQPRHGLREAAARRAVAALVAMMQPRHGLPWWAGGR